MAKSTHRSDPSAQFPTSSPALAHFIPLPPAVATRRRKLLRAQGLGVQLELLSLSFLLLLPACDSSTLPPATNPNAIDASVYFPIELGRYWVYFDAEDHFLTLEFTRESSVGGYPVLVLTWTEDWDPLHGTEPAPLLEQYFALDERRGTLLYGWRDYAARTSATYLPGVVFAGLEMELELPVVTSTAANGLLQEFEATLIAEGMVQTYFGDFLSAIDITFGPAGEEQPKHFLAEEVGMVKFDRAGVRWQLYDYGYH